MKRKLYRSTLEQFMARHGEGPSRYARELTLLMGFALFFLAMLAGSASVVVGAACLTGALFGMPAWYERCLVKTKRRIIENCLCLGCAYPLHRTPLDPEGGGACPECGRAFSKLMYEGSKEPV